MNAAFLTIFTVFWSGLVLTFDGFIIHEVFKQAESADYQFMTGAVTHSEVRIHHSSREEQLMNQSSIIGMKSAVRHSQARG
jgi:hypothetical protein